MMMPGREYQAQPSRFGFNGKENDNDVKGFGNQQDYGMRIYDGRLGKFFTVDPLQEKFPWNSPYSFSEGDPVNYIDLDGLEQVTSKPARVTVPQLSNWSVDKNGQLVNSTQLLREPINGGAYSLQNPFISQAEFESLIPPGGGAYMNPDGLSVTIIPSNGHGSYSVSILKPVRPKRQITWVDRAILRVFMEDAARRNTFTRWNTSIQAYEIITNDPSTLSQHYLSDVQRRLIDGNATEQDRIYEKELRRRSILYEINAKHDPSKAKGGSDASVLPSNHLELWQNRSYYDESTDTWWSAEGRGKKTVYHRFSSDNNGAFHWSGSTGKNVNRKGKPVVSIPEDQVPIEAKRR